MQQMTHETLDTGLGSFRDSSPDYMLAPVGLASMQDQAQKLAEYGRNGDVYIVHAAQGETVIPLEVLNANPKVKGLLYKQMRDMGLDPKEFVVGDELNSINPVTGLPEFFFKKIFRTVKKVVKKVIKIAKKIAPIALPLIAATFGFPFLSPTLFGPGSFGASALAGGLGTLAQGGSFKDALKSGLMAGGITAIGAGFTGEGTFGENISKSFYDQGRTATFSQNVGDFFKSAPKAPTEFTSMDPPEPGYIDPISPVERVDLGNAFDPGRAGAVDLGNAFDPGRATAFPRSQDYGLRMKPRHHIDADFSELRTFPGSEASQVTRTFPGSEASQIASAENLLAAKEQSSWLPDVLKPVFPERLTPAELVKETGMSLADATKMLEPGAGVNPTYFQQYAGKVGAGLGAAYLGGAFDPEEVDQPEGHPDYVNPAWDLAREEGESDADYDARLKVHRRKYLIPDEALDPTRFTPPPYVIPPYQPYQQRRQQSMLAADGGMAAYPRRELLVEGPGTERSDDIPAMLSDGEFVMNSKSVRGADPSGRGNRYAGARNLYDMMRNFEMKG
jgi:hypothetical protein